MSKSQRFCLAKTFMLPFLFLLANCTKSISLNEINLEANNRCELLSQKIDWDKPIPSLNAISLMYRGKCYTETIKYATIAKEKLGQKTFSILRETMELFLPEGSVTDYVLESYERGYLTFLTASSYQQQKNENAVTVELNRLYNEETALTYNFGQDPVNALIQAAMWDNRAHSSFSSRPFWLWLVKSEDIDQTTKTFAQAQIDRIDQKRPAKKWQLSEIGSFPKINWSLNFIDSDKGYFSFKPDKEFLKTCHSTDSIVINTSSWFRKVSMRHAKSYHPIVNAKSWIRAPIGIAYGITTVAAGAGLMVTGCGIDIGLKGDGTLCGFSIQGGVATMAASGDVVDFTLQPDLRHWEYLPEALYLSTTDSNSSKEPCLESLKGQENYRLF